MKKESGSAGEERTQGGSNLGQSFLGKNERREKRERQRDREREVFSLGKMSKERE